MDRHIKMVVLLAVYLLLAGCAILPETTLVAELTPSNPQPISTVIPEIRMPVEVASSATPAPTTVWLPYGEDQVVFTIPNTEPWSGREGDLRPGWKGWGAETFTVAEDGTFWIADTAVNPNRLLHYDLKGQLLQEISLGDKVVYVKDLALAQDSLWVLDTSAVQPSVIQFSSRGESHSSIEVPADVFSLMVGEEDELLVFGLNGYMELINAAGETTQRPLDELSYYGHTFKVGNYDNATGRIPIFVDGAPFDISPDFIVETEPFPGFNRDGSFTLAGYVQVDDYQADRQVRYYNPTGELLGAARQHPQTFYKDWNHHLAFGPDGSVYQLLSNPDHSVQVIRLGFAEKLPPLPDEVLATPTPMAPILPPEPAVTDEEQALNTLIGFFADLSTANYAGASARFRGKVDEYLRDPTPQESAEEYWEYACTYLWCLPVAEITDIEQVAEDEYLFYVVFMQPDGTRFQIGACCGGDPAATPPVWQFAYPVQKIDGRWKVMRAPLFTP